MSRPSITYKYCPVCGTQYTEEQQKQLHKACQNCDYILHENQHATVGAVILKDNNVLLGKRAIDPAAGTWDLPGGFVEANETIEQAILREVKEELSIDAKIIKLLGSFGPTWYEYKGKGQYNTDLYFLIEPLSENFKAADDVNEIQWFPLNQLPPKEELSFPAVTKVLDYIKKTQI